MPDITGKLTDEEYSLLVRFTKTTGVALADIVQEATQGCVAAAKEFLSSKAPASSNTTA